MIDLNLALLTWLKASPALAALVGTNIFSPQLPEGFSALVDTAPSPASRAVVIKKRGGSPEPEIPDVYDPSFAVESWALEAPDANQINGVVHDLLHGANGVDLGTAGYVILCQEEVGGQDILDSETGWPYVLAYYHIKLRGPAAGAGSDTTLVLGPGVSGGPLKRYDNADDGGLSPTADPKVWTLSVPISATALVFRDGVLLDPLEDYVPSGSTLTLTVSPSPGTNLAILQ